MSRQPPPPAPSPALPSPVTTGEVPETTAIVCRNVVKTFISAAGVVPALRGVDLDVARGGVTMLVGPSGCGKTTLISIVAGILKADGGQCMVLGHDLAALRGIALLDFRARNIGFIFQQFRLVPTLSVAQNVAVPQIINGLSRRAALADAEAMLARVGLAARGADPPASLSGGQQQRVAIARALVHRPALVVCDEPTSALDHETGERVIAMMRQMVLEQRTTVLIVTHDNRIFPFADHIARMDDGRIVGIEAAGAPPPASPGPALPSATGR